MLTFEEWYKSNYPDLDPELDDCYKMLMKCYQDGISAGMEIMEIADWCPQ
jgi:hypothetical protein